MTGRPISELYVALMEWAETQGAADLSKQPGLWRGSTDEWDAAINPHNEEVEDVPPYSWTLTHRDYVVMCVIGPFDGVIGGGYPEDKIIDHFRGQS